MKYFVVSQHRVEDKLGLVYLQRHLTLAHA